MATTRTNPADGARRRIFLLCVTTLVLAAGAATTTSSAAIPQNRPPIASPPEGLGTATLHEVGGVGSSSPPVAAPTEAPYLASHRGALLNNPGGAAWRFDEMRDAGFDWVALNVGDHEPRRWGDVRARAEAAGLEVVPWARLGHPHLGETRDDCLRKLGLLLDTAKAWRTTRPIVNVETEIKPAHLGGVITPEEVARELERAGMDEAGISTEAWLYDISWVTLSRYAILLQILPRDNRWAPADVRSKQHAAEKRARDYGFAHVGSSMQTYEMEDGSDPLPEWFDLSGLNRSVIWGDNVAAQGAGEWKRWAS